MSKTRIPEKTQLLVWLAAGGRCQYHGCNADLIGDLVAGNDDAKVGYIAHVVADQPGGPRGHPTESSRLAADRANLMLMCPVHHKIIDVDDVDGHPVPLLLDMKAAHETRIALLTEIAEDRASHVLCYAAGIGAHESPVAYHRVRQDMLPERYPADGRAVVVGFFLLLWDQVLTAVPCLLPWRAAPREPSLAPVAEGFCNLPE